MSEEQPVKYNHYRAVFKSDHLGVADVEDMMASGHNLIVTITHCTQHMPGDNPIKVAGKSGKFNVAHFSDKSMKPWVMNAQNSAMVKKLSGTSSVNINEWPEVTLQLWIDGTVKFAGEHTGGVRILDKKITKEKQWLVPEMAKAWKNAKAALIRDGDFSKVLDKVNMSDPDQDKMKAEVEAAKDA